MFFSKTSASQTEHDARRDRLKTNGHKLLEKPLPGVS